MQRMLLAVLFICGIFLCIPGYVFADTTFDLDDDLEKIAIENGGTYVLPASGSPYVFNHGITITQPITITVEPGVILQIADDYSISVTNGTFNAVGTTENPITITAKDNRFNQIRVGDVLNDVHVNFEHVSINRGNWCTIVARSTTVFTHVSFTDCRTVPIATGAGGVHLTLDSISYTALSGNVIDAFLYVGLRSDITEENSLHLDVKNTDFIQDGYHTIRVSDQSGSLYDPGAVHIKISENVFSGTVQDQRPFILDQAQLVTIDATDNYWGTSQGPYIVGVGERTNGPMVDENIMFVPFKAYDPGLIHCCSSVLFLPGIEGSRLYNKREDGTEDQLWEPNWRSDVEDLYATIQGESQPGIYTKDIIERTNVTKGVFDKSFYFSINEDLNSLKQRNIITDYTPVPYDWRYNVDYILSHGIDLPNGQKMDIVAELERMAAGSHTGKVTIVSHSNGGLLTKMLVKELESQGKQHLVDKVVLAGVPQNGTPEAITALLHGLEFKFPVSILAPESHNREMARNIPMTYSLLPSEKYFEGLALHEAPIVLDPALDHSIYSAVYGNSIDTYTELKDFILDVHNQRTLPNITDTRYPTIGNGVLYNRAETDIHGVLDEYVFPENIKVHEISGTGILTTYQLFYKNYAFGPCDQDDVFSCRFRIIPKKSIYGDGTVLNRSSASGNPNTQSHFIDLYEYNRLHETSLDHGTMLESSSAINLISAIIQDKGAEEVPLLEESKIPVQYDTVPMTTTVIHGPAEVHVYDDQLRHTGPITVQDEEGNDRVIIETQIPNVLYEVMEGMIVVGAIGNSTYTVKIKNTGSGAVAVDIGHSVGNQETSNTSFDSQEVSNGSNSEIHITPGTPNTEIVLDTDGDSVPDTEIGSNGETTDLFPDEDIEEDPEEPITGSEPVTPPSDGVVLVNSTNPTAKEEDIVPIVLALDSNSSVLEETVPVNVIQKVADPPTEMNMVVNQPVENDILIVDIRSDEKDRDLAKTQIASAGSALRGDWGLGDFIRKIKNNNMWGSNNLGTLDFFLGWLVLLPVGLLVSIIIYFFKKNKQIFYFLSAWGLYLLMLLIYSNKIDGSHIEIKYYLTFLIPGLLLSTFFLFLSYRKTSSYKKTTLLIILNLVILTLAIWLINR